MGRKSWKEELEFKKIVELSICVLKKALQSEEVSDSKKIEIATHLVGKAMPRDVLLQGGIKLQKIEIEFVDKKENG